MSSWPPKGTFEVPPIAAKLPPWPTTSKPAEPKPVEAKSTWIPVKATVPVRWQDDEEKKQQFGIELAKLPESPFNAACAVFPTNTSQALWALQNWPNDPIVMASRDLYIQAVEENTNLLDKAALAAKLLKFSDEKTSDGKFYLYEGKDRLAALKLFAEVQGFIGKVNIDASTNFNQTNNEMKITFVEPENKEVKTIKPSVTIIDNEDNLEILNGLKLVG